MSEQRKDGMHFQWENNRNSSYSTFMNRRQSVFAESFNPEEEEFEPPYHPKTPEEYELIKSGLKCHFPFSHVQEGDFERIINAMIKQNVSKGEEVMKEGDEGEYFFFVDSGVFEEYVTENGVRKVTSVYDSRGCFGALALMYNVPRASSVVAISDGSLWALDRRTFRNTVSKSAYRKRVIYDSILQHVPMLACLTESERVNLAEALVDVTFEDGECIIGENSAANGMFFVLSGSVQVRRRGAGSKSEMVVKRLTEGDYFGELAFVSETPRTDSAYASGRVQVAFLEVEAFERLLGPCSDIMKRLMDSNL